MDENTVLNRNHKDRHRFHELHRYDFCEICGCLFIFEAVSYAPMAHPVTHENVEAARKPFLSNYCYPGALLGAPTLLAIFGTV
jgi:hypothetical protein